MQTYIPSIKKQTDVIIDLKNTNMTVYEALGRIEAIRVTGRYSEFYIDSDSNAIVGVLA